MIRQDSDWLNENGSIFKQYGCYIMDILWFVNKFTNRTWTPQNIRRFVEHCRAENWISENLFVRKPEAIFKYAGLPVKIKWDKEYTHKRPVSETCLPDEFEIQLWRNPRTGYGHFVAGDGKGNVTYDPLGESVTVAEGGMESKRIFRRL